MFNLPALPEIGLDSKTICDICMRKKSSEFYSCGLHKMCSDCQKRFSSLGSCPLCGKCNQRCVEKMMGHFIPAPVTYVPPTQHVIEEPAAPSVIEEPPMSKEEEFGLQPCSSDSSLLNSISSIETVSDSDDTELCCQDSYFDDCGEDPFASLDAEFNKNENRNQKSCSGLYRCCCSVYDPSFKEHCDASTEKRKTLQKSRHMTSEEFQKMIDVCKDL